MNRFLSFVMVLMVTLFTSTAFAWTPPPAPADGSYVVDLTGKLSSAHKSLLNHKIEQMNRDTANEYGILLVPSMDGSSIEDVANSTYRAWGVGKKGLDNGCLIVVAVAERKSRIETGKGVEGDVPDLKANDILKRNLNPHLRTGDFYGGFDDTLSALNSQIVSHRAEANRVAAPATAPVPQATGGCSVGGAEFGASLAVFVVGMFIFLMMRSRNNKKRETLRAMALESARMRDQQHSVATKVAEAAELQRRRDSIAAAAAKKQREAEEAEQAARIARCRALRDTQRSISYEPPKSSRPEVSRSVTVAASAAATASVAEQLRKQREADEARDARARRDREEQKRRDEEERREEQRRAERRRDREREEEEERSRSSSSSSFDWGGGSSGGGFGGFGGGDSGGGGSSSDW